MDVYLCQTCAEASDDEDDEDTDEEEEKRQDGKASGSTSTASPPSLSPKQRHRSSGMSASFAEGAIGGASDGKLKRLGESFRKSSAMAKGKRGAIGSNAVRLAARRGP